MKNTVGVHLPDKKGRLLCNGHCNWEECNQPRWICNDCGYIACDMCIDDYERALEKEVNINLNGASFCINCRSVDTFIEWDE